jgi:drug/metabolite transporter (DMT)-like permease
VQEIELILVAAGLIVSAAYIVAQSRSRGTTDHFAVRLLLGLIPAVVAVSIVLINRFDMVPDDLEQNLWLLSIVVVSGLLILGTGYRLARR